MPAAALSPITSASCSRPGSSLIGTRLDCSGGARRDGVEADNACASVYVARIIGYSSDALVFDRKWTAHDIRRLALWRTVSSTLPLWLFTLGVDGFRERNTVAVLWLVAGGLIALLAVARLHRVEGSGSATSNRVTFTNVHLYWQKEWAYRCVRSRSFHSAGGI